ncbi:MAG: hypothetical protein HRU13_08160 [Phycisphaerales bacterium]|nr:hypothetical protein [Phycisphaerales bacterium]
MPRFATRTLLVAAGALAAVAFAAMPDVALAQAGQSLRPPAPSQPANPPVIANFLIAGVVLISMIAATVIPAKRGHQD